MPKRISANVTVLTYRRTAGWVATKAHDVGVGLEVAQFREDVGVEQPASHSFTSRTRWPQFGVIEVQLPHTLIRHGAHQSIARARVAQAVEFVARHHHDGVFPLHGDPLRSCPTGEADHLAEAGLGVLQSARSAPPCSLRVSYSYP